VLPPFPDRLRLAARRSLERLGTSNGDHGDSSRRRRCVVASSAFVARGSRAGGSRNVARTGSAHCGQSGAVGRRRRGVAAGSVARRAARPGRPRDRSPRCRCLTSRGFCRGGRLRFTQDGAVLPGVAQVAMRQAHAARNILRSVRL
jgi:hypothetical protein